MPSRICIHCRTRITGRISACPYLCAHCEAMVRNAQSSERFIYLDESY
ncbi:MAG TPA: hypothetical protein VJI52_03975 [Candidatus Nanoarchaeia archaeon]|nr:hypothetical protein [Candidatus Nanoarchaeia archaeon]